MTAGKRDRAPPTVRRKAACRLNAHRSFFMTDGITVSLDKKRGKGSHALLKFGDRRTILKDLRKTVGPGLLRKMCRDLGITPEDLK